MPTEKDNNLDKKLGEQEGKEVILPQLLEFYNNLSHIQSRVEQHLGTPRPGLNSEAITERIEHGLPLIGFDELNLDWSLLRDTFAEVIAAFTQYPELFGLIPENLMESGANRFLTQETVKAWYEKNRLPSFSPANWA